MYKIFNDKWTNELTFIIRLEDNAYIPISSDNTDYQAYLKWLEEGNEPLPAEEAAAE